MHSHFFPVVMKLSLIIVTITLIHCPASLRADNEKYLTCEAPFNCSNLVNLSYPFWASNRPNYCGHPSFQLNCSSSVPQINIATMNYSVLEIVDSSRTLRVARTDYLDTICPAALVNTTIDNNLFSCITSADTNLTLYYNCRSPLAAIPNLPFYQFNCSINSSTNFINYYTLTSQTFLAISNLIGACSYWVNVPVLQSAVPTATTYDAVIAAIDSGFMLGWNASNSQCDTCLRAEGLCGSVPNTSTFACHCTNGTFASGCSTESTRPTINRLELVAVVNASSPTPHSPTTVPVVYPRSPTPHSPTTVPVVYPRPPFNVPAAEVPGHPPTQHPTPAPFTVPPQIVVPFSKRNWRLIIAIGIPASAVGILVISTVIICMFKRGHLSCNAIVCWKGDAKNNHINAEEFIKNYGSIVPKRYTYSEVKKLTYSLKEKIGQGGFGAVYKGQLPDGRMVAVKVLKQSNGNGEEFINEVASISRTSHVNVVALLGFCYERNKRALIYEFMSNGSLNKFIYDKRNRCLDRNTMFQISVGIARGLEYLHCGCRTRILHFDIKPHNILLDEDLCPKISDFGLAKLCKIKESIISMTGMRGTIGYIAPEVFNRNFGGVSHKSDVYSYGMLILEMIGGRKNFDGEASHTSELYFPHWVYKKLELGESFGALGGITEEEEDTLKKMMIVSLWCIQTNPRNRPSMSKVIEMLEGTLQSLQLPKPFLDSPRRSPQNSFGNSSLS